MAQGGARVRSGPPPDPNALRRSRDSGDWVTLPFEGRTAPAPAWPLGDQSDREAELWAFHWALPQAVEWERLRLDYQVALFVRRFAEAEVPGSPVTVSTWVRQQNDALGISVPGMLSLKWRVGDPAAEAGPVQTATSAASTRSRLRVVDDGA